MLNLTDEQKSAFKGAQFPHLQWRISFPDRVIKSRPAVSNDEEELNAQLENYKEYGLKKLSPFYKTRLNCGVTAILGNDNEDYSGAWFIIFEKGHMTLKKYINGGALGLLPCYHPRDCHYYISDILPYNGKESFEDLHKYGCEFFVCTGPAEPGPTQTGSVSRSLYITDFSLLNYFPQGVTGTDYPFDGCSISCSRKDDGWMYYYVNQLGEQCEHYMPFSPLGMLMAEPLEDITNEKMPIDEMTLKESLCSQEQLQFGCCEASEMSFTVFTDAKINTGDRVVVEMETQGVTVPYGHYFINEVTRPTDLQLRRERSVRAYDTMIKLDTDCLQALNYHLEWPATIKSIRDILAEIYQYEQEDIVLPNDDMVVDKSILENATTLTGRTVLESICEMNCCFGHFSRIGVLQYKSLSNVVVEEPEYFDPSASQYEDYVCAYIRKVIAIKENTRIAVGDGSNEYYLVDNAIMEGMANADIATALGRISTQVRKSHYRPCSFALRALPYLEVGDRIQIYVDESTIINTIILSHTLDGSQGIVQNIEAAGPEYRSNSDINVYGGTGKPGSNGTSGESGKTPEYGVDFLTPEEQAIIKADIIAELIAYIDTELLTAAY